MLGMFISVVMSTFLIPWGLTPLGLTHLWGQSHVVMIVVFNAGTSMQHSG